MVPSGIGLGGGSSAYLVGGTRTQRPPSTPRAGTASGVGIDSISLSGGGQLLGRLQTLQARDPLEFRRVLQQSAGALQAAARQAGNTPRGRALADLAARMQRVANGGDVSLLNPAAPVNRVQSAYATGQPDSLQELFGLLGNGPVAHGMRVSPAAPSGTDPHYVLKSALSSLKQI